MLHLSEISPSFRFINYKILNFHFRYFDNLIQFLTKLSRDSSASELLNNPTPMKSSTPGKSWIIKLFQVLIFEN